MKAVKTDSGKWRAVATYKDATGRVRKKSFTKESKKEAVRAAMQFEAASSVPRETEDRTVEDVVAAYINAKKAVLSANTVAGYNKILRCNIHPYFIAIVRIRVLSDIRMQEWISAMADKKLSAKTIRNAFSLVAAAVAMCAPGAGQWHVQFPQAAPKNVYIPSRDDLAACLAVAGQEMAKAIRIAMYGGLRQGEIAALDAEDIDRAAGTVHVTKAQARTEDGGHMIKPPKTGRSVRIVPLPRFVIDGLPDSGRVVNLDCNEISWRWQKIVKKAGCPHFNFHALRKYSASMAIASGCGMETVKAMHGWSNSYTALEHYIRPVSDVVKAETAALIASYDAVHI